MKETIVINEEKLPEFADLVAEKISSIEGGKAKVILLNGDLGAGKTTFTKHLAKSLGANDEVNSPTFILKKEYSLSHPIIKKLVHIDAYRFNNPKEAKVLRINSDLEDKSSLVIIEWPEKMQFVDSDMRINFNVIDDDTREVIIDYEE